MWRKLRKQHASLSSSPLFDPGWYRATYGAAGWGIAVWALPLWHFLLIGAKAGHSPSARFDTQWYLATYPDVAASGMNPLVHYLLHGRYEARLPKALQAARRDQIIWSRQDSTALDQLQHLLDDSDWQEASYAAWSLGRWYGHLRQWQEVLRVMSRHHSVVEPIPGHLTPCLLYADALRMNGRPDVAAAYLQSLLEDKPESADLCLSLANLSGRGSLGSVSRTTVTEWLSWVNRPYLAHGLQQLVLRGEPMLLSMDSLSTVVAESNHGIQGDLCEQHPLVSVIIPAHNAANTIATTLKSLQCQTWRTLELLVIDDGSTDNTAAVAGALAASDARVRVVKLGRNEGAYAARNVGLRLARGELITVHDSDDWSHPEKIARQVRPLLETPGLAATVSHWVRATSWLEFGGWQSPEGWMGWVHRNVSSLMIRREVFERLGYWDRVRCNGDVEYYYRVLHAFGCRAIHEVLPGIPLSFGRQHAGSLTQRSDMNIFTVFGGLRKDYQDAAYEWHAKAIMPSELYLEEHPSARPFSAPSAICIDDFT